MRERGRERGGRRERDRGRDGNDWRGREGEESREDKERVGSKTKRARGAEIAIERRERKKKEPVMYDSGRTNISIFACCTAQLLCC